MITEKIRYSLVVQRDAMSGENVVRCSSRDIISTRINPLYGNMIR